MKNGDPIIIEFEGRSLRGRVTLVNRFDKAGMVEFDGMLGGYVWRMPIMTHEDGSQTDLINNQPVKISPAPSGLQLL